MKKIAFMILLGLSATNAQAEVKETIIDMTKGLVKLTKEVSSGVTEGFKEGRSSTESSDGSVVVTNEEETLAYIDIDLMSVSPKTDSNQTVVELSFKNRHQKPVKITGLSGEGVLLTIDKEGFSHTLASWQQIEFIVPNEAARKYAFTFFGDASEVKQVRVWRKTYDVAG
ncbi:hypothetical protein [Photobacterium sp. 1_MG-2023]|uniref:hypothetical protein n=1 Tax=Photobacterium sp. 1_MG-2023 TaxID=3062646 RepID=UPI0026E373CA|nr:hypothetical protein [Photobacterium sp. 1_MG-2023]MDO6704920.1 hypothetical protein [Photobacterium sp. 1_MG-2023]